MSAAAGIVCRVKPGEQVVEGQPLLELHTEQSDRVAWALRRFERGSRHCRRGPGNRRGRPGGDQVSSTPKLEEIRAVPKVLLHDHLDGGLRPSTVVELAGRAGLPRSSDDRPW